MIGRRGFLRQAGAGAAMLALAPLERALAAGARDWRAPPALRLVLVLGAPPGVRAEVASALRRGTALGLEEAQRAASLLGGSAAGIDLLIVEDWRAHAALPSLTRDAVVLAGCAALELRALAAGTTERGVPLVDVFAGADALRAEPCGRWVLHVAPSDAMRVDAAAAWARREEGWGVVLPSNAADDLVGRARARLGDAARVAVGEPRQDGRWVAPLASAEELREGAAAVHPWHHTLERFGAAQLNDRYRAEFGEEMPAAAWASWFAVKAAWEMVARAGSAAELERPPRIRFDGHKGVPLDFRPWDGQLRQPLYVVGRDDAGAERVLAELPGRVSGSVREALDAYGVAAGEHRCQGG